MKLVAGCVNFYDSGINLESGVVHGQASDTFLQVSDGLSVHDSCLILAAGGVHVYDSGLILASGGVHV